MNRFPISAGLPSWLGNLFVLACLLVLAAYAAQWHGGDWWPAPPPGRRWLLASLALATYLVFFLAMVRPTRRAHQRDDALGDVDIVHVVYASQTGFSLQLAQRTFDSLQASGVASRLAPLESLTPMRLQQARRILFIVSTTGEGDPPDHAIGFTRACMQQAPDLSQLHYAVLALGDRTYQQFCGFGHQLDYWLRQQGAQPLFDLVEVDNADEAALRHWQQGLGNVGALPELPDWTPVEYQRWRLQARHELNPGSAGSPVFHLALVPQDPSHLAWRAGDIAEVGPRHPRAVIDAWLANNPWTTSLPGTERASLIEQLSLSHLPAPLAQPPASLPPWLAELTRLPHREYSIASIPAEGTLNLLVRLATTATGELGLGSGWLCRHAGIGESIELRIRSNPSFHAPDEKQPMILIGNGTGLAGLRAHLKAREASGTGHHWLLWGERNRERDHFYQDELEAWQQSGLLEHADLVFSRDQPERRYVQHRLAEHAPRLRQWIAEGAAIHVCGSLQGMAPAIDHQLRGILGNGCVEALLAAHRYRRDVY